jgi:hypothetical protein
MLLSEGFRGLTAKQVEANSLLASGAKHVMLFGGSRCRGRRPDRCSRNLTVTDLGEVHEAIVLAELRRDRYRKAIPQLQQKLAERLSFEYAEKRKAETNKIQTVRDALTNEWQDSSSTIAGAFGFLTFTQCGERPDR